MEAIYKTFVDNQVKMEQTTAMVGNTYGQYKYDDKKYTWTVIVSALYGMGFK